MNQAELWRLSLSLCLSRGVRWHLWCVYSILSPIMNCKRMCHICISPFKVLSMLLWREVWVKLVEMGIRLASLNFPFSQHLKHWKQVFVKPHIFPYFIFEFQMPSYSVLYQKRVKSNLSLLVFFSLQGQRPCFPSSHRTWWWWRASLWHYHALYPVTMVLSCGSKTAWRWELAETSLVTNDIYPLERVTLDFSITLRFPY